MNIGFVSRAGAADPDDVMDITDPRDLALLSASSLSALGSLIVIFTFIRYRSLRRHPSQLILSRSLLDLLFCAGEQAPVLAQACGALALARDRRAACCLRAM